MLPVKISRFGTSVPVDGRRGRKYSPSTPLGNTWIGAGTYSRSTSRSRGAVTEQASNCSASRRSNRRTLLASSRKPRERGKGADRPYSSHFSESASPKSMIFRHPRWPATYGPIDEQCTTIASISPRASTPRTIRVRLDE